MGKKQNDAIAARTTRFDAQLLAYKQSQQQQPPPQSNTVQSGAPISRCAQRVEQHSVEASQRGNETRSGRPFHIQTQQHTPRQRDATNALFGLGFPGHAYYGQPQCEHAYDVPLDARQSRFPAHERPEYHQREHAYYGPYTAAHAGRVTPGQAQLASEGAFYPQPHYDGYTQTWQPVTARPDLSYTCTQFGPPQPQALYGWPQPAYCPRFGQQQHQHRRYEAAQPGMYAQCNLPIERNGQSTYIDVPADVLDRSKTFDICESINTEAQRRIQRRVIKALQSGMKLKSSIDQPTRTASDKRTKPSLDLSPKPKVTKVKKWSKNEAYERPEYTAPRPKQCKKPAPDLGPQPKIDTSSGKPWPDKAKSYDEGQVPRVQPTVATHPSSVMLDNGTPVDGKLFLRAQPTAKPHPSCVKLDDNGVSEVGRELPVQPTAKTHPSGVMLEENGASVDGQWFPVVQPTATTYPSCVKLDDNGTPVDGQVLPAQPTAKPHPSCVKLDDNGTPVDGRVLSAQPTSKPHPSCVKLDDNGVSEVGRELPVQPTAKTHPSGVMLEENGASVDGRRDLAQMTAKPHPSSGMPDGTATRTMHLTGRRCAFWFWTAGSRTSERDKRRSSRCIDIAATSAQQPTPSLRNPIRDCSDAVASIN